MIIINNRNLKHLPIFCFETLTGIASLMNGTPNKHDKSIYLCQYVLFFCDCGIFISNLIIKLNFFRFFVVFILDRGWDFSVDYLPKS